MSETKAVEARWIATGERLPRDGQRVVVWWPTTNTFLDASKPETAVRLYAMTFHQGVSDEEARRRGYWTSDDEHGNNRVPYRWKDGPMMLYGQEVTHWMEIEGPDAKIQAALGGGGENPLH